MIPASTYRLQLHGGFTFDDAREVSAYLRELGVSHIYCSPYLQATPGSTHGYDVVDHNRVNEELGGADAHQELVDELQRLGLGQVLDIVPNHMAIGSRDNTWWWDVLENGQSSHYARYFDVDWDPPEARLQNMVLVPILGDHYGRVLENGELKIEREGGRFIIRYHDTVLPVAPRSMGPLLTKAAQNCGSEELEFIADVLMTLPEATATDAASVARRHRDKEILARQLAELCSGEPRIAEAVDHVLAEVNHHYDSLDSVFGHQNYRIAFWRTAGRDLGYRRFFDINNLIGLRMEDRRVFRDTHRLILEWLRAGVLDGVRIDHPDGLRDPEEYFARLHRASPSAWIVAEKILESDEELRDTWQIAGTTGYEFLNRLGGLFVDPRGEEPLTQTWIDFTGEGVDYHEIVRARKHQVLRGTLGSDVNRLTAQFMDVCERHRRFRDFTRSQIHDALREAIASFPVYRTYVREEGEVHEHDRAHIQYAIEDAKQHRTDLPPDLFDFLQSVLLKQVAGSVESEFVQRFQQFTGPAMAKGVEDTTFYAFNRLASLNEVGGDPGRFGLSLEEFHRLMSESQTKWPGAMLTTSTHDTKRSEDVRSRLHLLSEIPNAWAEIVARWAAHNERYRSENAPDRSMEYLLYQTLVGAWPIEPERVLTYMEKASREAKAFTSWTDPNPDYDQALAKFVRGVMDDKQIMADIASFAQKLVDPGRITSLAQTLIKLTAPGVPDIYQGTELWDLSLVDPDNRRPVDYDLRRRLLTEMTSMTVEQVRERSDEGLPKLWVTHRTLVVRRDHRRLFDPGTTYTPVQARGAKACHAVAYLRGERALTVAPRLVMGLADGWADTVIDVSEGRWTNVLTGDRVGKGPVLLTQLLSRFPVALLVRE